MDLSNKKNLNEMLIKAITGDWYSGIGERRDYSVTELLKPAKIIHLTNRHKDEIQEDASERIFMLLGSAVHEILEKANGDSAKAKIIYRVERFIEKVNNNPDIEPTEQAFFDYIKNGGGFGFLQNVGELLARLREERFMVERRFKYTTKAGKIITGGIDLYDKEEKSLHDYKITSIWTYMYRNRPGSRMDDYTNQMNMYRLLMEKSDYEVNSLVLNMIFRDYSKTKAKREHGYPDPVETIELPLLGLDIVEQMIETKVAEIEKYTNTPDDLIPPCSERDRWQQANTWAVRKKANKTASKVEHSYASSKRWMDEQIQKEIEKYMAKGMTMSTAIEKANQIFTLEKREGLPSRCIDYCPVAKFCNYYRSLPEEAKND
jgi:hypothetical protein